MQKDQKSLYHEEVLQRLSSPEQLEQVIQVVNPRGWLALSVAGILVMALVVWSFVGTVPHRVSGEGLLTHMGSVHEVQATSYGQLSSLAVKVGDQVTKGQTIAQITQYDLHARIQSAEARLKEAKLRTREASASGTEEIELQRDKLAQQRQATGVSLSAQRDHLRVLSERRESIQDLLEHGLVTRQEVETVIAEIKNTRRLIAQELTTLKEIDLAAQRLSSKKKQELLVGEQQVNDLKRELGSLQDEFARTSAVVSPVDGFIFEIRARAGDRVQPGLPLVNIETEHVGGRHLQVVIFVPAQKGKLVKEAMTVEISPSTIPSEKYGYLKGRVQQVSRFSVSEEGMYRLVMNRQLVDVFAQRVGPAPISVLVELQDAGGEEGGYAWTSRIPPPISIQAGTLATARITIEEQRPIDLVFPFLRRTTGL